MWGGEGAQLTAHDAWQRSSAALVDGEPRGPMAVTPPPTLSVVVPAYNARSRLPACLGSLYRQSYPRERYEVIVVDDGSRDDTAEQARLLGRRWAGTLKVIRQANGGPARARNAGVRAASGEIVAFLDADCVADPDWLAELVAVLATSAADAVGGPIWNHAYRDPVSRFLTASRFYRHRARHGQVEYLVTANLAMRRETFEALGGFHEATGTWSEDADLSFRMTKEGYSLLLASRGRVRHFGSPTTVRGLARELFRYGYGSYRLSFQWPGGRQPIRELVRRAGAIALAPLLALRCARQVGLWQSVRFVPLVVVEHAAFAAGIIRGMTEDDGQHV